MSQQSKSSFQVLSLLYALILTTPHLSAIDMSISSETRIKSTQHSAVRLSVDHRAVGHIAILVEDPLGDFTLVPALTSPVLSAGPIRFQGLAYAAVEPVSSSLDAQFAPNDVDIDFGFDPGARRGFAVHLPDRKIIVAAYRVPTGGDVFLGQTSLRHPGLSSAAVAIIASMPVVGDRSDGSWYLHSRTAGGPHLQVGLSVDQQRNHIDMRTRFLFSGGLQMSPGVVWSSGARYRKNGTEVGVLLGGASETYRNTYGKPCSELLWAHTEVGLGTATKGRVRLTVPQAPDGAGFYSAEAAWSAATPAERLLQLGGEVVLTGTPGQAMDLAAEEFVETLLVGGLLRVGVLGRHRDGSHTGRLYSSVDTDTVLGEAEFTILWTDGFFQASAKTSARIELAAATIEVIVEGEDLVGANPLREHFVGELRISFDRHYHQD